MGRVGQAIAFPWPVNASWRRIPCTGRRRGPSGHRPGESPRATETPPSGRPAASTRSLPAWVERIPAKRIEREQAVIARVPIGGMARALRVVEDGDAEPLAVQFGGVIHPVGALAPNLHHAHTPVRIHDLAAP